MTSLNVYLNFPGTTREALTRYHKIFGGDLELNTFGQFNSLPDGHPDRDKIMHGAVTGPFTLFAADSLEGMTPEPFTPGNNVNLSLNGDNVEQLTSWFADLAEGGQIIMPLARQVWGDLYGDLVDQFGLHWMVNISDRTAAEH